LRLNRLLTDSQSELTLDGLLPGGYDLTLRLLNKEPHDTVVDSDGNIVDDMYVTMSEFLIDHIDFMHKIDSISHYTDNNGNSVKTCGFLGFNRDFKIWFQTPGMYFERNCRILDPAQLHDWITEDLHQEATA